MGMGRQAAGLLPELAEHLATESGWIVATGTLSGVGGSTGTFSATQWRADLHDDPRSRRRGGAPDLDWPASASAVRSRWRSPPRTNASAASRRSRRRRTRAVVRRRRRVPIARCRSPASWATKSDLLPAEQLRDDVLRDRSAGVDREDPTAPTHGRPRDRGHRDPALRRARPRRGGRRSSRTATDPGCRAPTAGRSADGGDVVRLARPAPLRAPRRVRRVVVAPPSCGSLASVRARTTTKWRSPAATSAAMFSALTPPVTKTGRSLRAWLATA